MKKCFKCHEVLPLSEFYRHPMMGDGHLGKCKRCARRDVQENRSARRQKYREYDRRRYRENPERRESIVKNKDPMKEWARLATRSAIARGVLERHACEVCGDELSDAHHLDYTRPLEVRWLCRKHHMQAHRMDEDRRIA